MPGFGVDEALPAEPASVSESGELAMPDLMALADADPEEVFPPRLGRRASRWRPLGRDGRRSPATNCPPGRCRLPASPWRLTPRCSRAVMARNRPGRLSLRPWNDRGVRRRFRSGPPAGPDAARRDCSREGRQETASQEETAGGNSAEEAHRR